MSTLRPHRFSLSLLAAAVGSVVGCVDTVPLPSEFDAAFTTGQICIPHDVATGAGMSFPAKFDLCVYRCVKIDHATAKVRTFYQCVGNQCQMVMLATAHATSDPTQEGCDAREMANPSADECTNESFLFQVGVPEFQSGPVEGDFLVSIPHLELEQGQKVIDRLEAGEDPNLVIQQEVGDQNYPQRQFMLNFAATHTPVASPDLIPASDCERISAP